MCISGGEHNSAYKQEPLQALFPPPKSNVPYTLLSAQDTRSLIARNSCCASQGSLLVHSLAWRGHQSKAASGRCKLTHQMASGPGHSNSLAKISGQHMGASTLPFSYCSLLDSPGFQQLLPFPLPIRQHIQEDFARP